MSASNYLENKILDHVFGSTSYTPPSRYVGLNSADPGETGTSELASSSGYARQVITFGTAVSGLISNSLAVVFTNTGSNWLATTYFSVWDSLSGGNFLGSGALTVSKTIQAGDTGTFAVGSLTITCD